MSSVDLGHPGEEQLVRYTTGEGSAGERDAVREHLDGCADCRAEYQQWEASLQACLQYREDVLIAHLPKAPSPWGDIRGRMDESDASLASRWGEWLGFGAVRRWAPALAAVAVVGVFAYKMYDAPSAKAAELLRRAALAETQAPKARRIQIRTGAHRVTRLVGSGVSPATQAAIADAASMASVEALFRSANYSWEDPLSAKSYMQWRDRLIDGRDEVSTGSGAYRIRTTSDTSQIAKATLQLRESDLHATGSTLEFRNRETVEITELPDEKTLEAPAATGSGADAVPARRQPEIAPPAPVEPVIPATPADELRVFVALRRLDADLGEPVEVTRTGNEVLVTGVGLDVARAQQIQNALAALPRVVVRFSEPDAATAPPAAPGVRSSTTNPTVGRLQAKLESTVGGRAVFEQWSEQVLERTELLMTRAHALRRLSRRFAPEVESQMEGEDRRVLLGLRDELAQALLGQESALQQLMAPAFRLSPASVAPAGSWQQASEELFQSAWKVDRLVGMVFGGAVGDAAQEPLESQFVRRLSEMRAAAEAYKRQ